MELSRREFIRLAGGCAGAAAAVTFLPGAVFGGESDATFAASAVLRPTFVAPVIVRPGQGIEFLKAAGGADVESAWLRTSNNTGASAIAVEQTTSAGETFLTPSARLEPGLYDLYVKATRGGKSRIERQPLAVSVVENFKNDFTFGVISDVHYGDPRITSKVPGFDHGKVFAREIDILNENKIEFCLCCGDLCFIPPKTKNEIMDYAEALTGRARFPTFTIPGNHEGYASGAGGRVSFDTIKYYSNFFGPLNFEASYGGVSLIGINTYDKSAERRNLFGGSGDEVDTGAFSAEQLAWLDAALGKARAASDSVILFGHQNPTNSVVDVNGPFEVVPFSETGRKELLGLMEKHSPDHMFVGHVHGVYEEMYSKTKIVTAPTAGSLPADGHPIGIYLVRVVAGKIAKIETVEIARV